MGRRVSVTNLALGPRGWPQLGTSEQTILKRGETQTLQVADNIFELLQRLSAGDKPEVELEDLGEIEDASLAARVTNIESVLASTEPKGREEKVTISGEGIQEAVDKALESVKGDLEARDQTIERQAEEIERLTKELEEAGADGEAKTYTVGPFVEKVLKAFDIQNFSDVQLVLDAIEAAFEPFAKFDPDGDLKPGGAAGAETTDQTGETQTPPAPGGGVEGDKKDHFDDMDDAALRKFILAQTGKDPHPNAKRETLLKKAREADTGEAV